jgi:Ca2+-binding RTX toxin-like protein
VGLGGILNIILLSLISAVGITILFLHPDQTSWAAVIECPATATVCNGTTGDDIIFGAWGAGLTVHGLAGNDFIETNGYADKSSYIYGDDGDDILIGGSGNDGLYGGKGNDRYDGRYGSDTILESVYIVGSSVSNDDVISGAEGDDFIISGEGFDRIHGGPGNDRIFPNSYTIRDFSYDDVNCGSDTGDTVEIYSGDGEIVSNCESVTDRDR